MKLRTVVHAAAVAGVVAVCALVPTSAGVPRAHAQAGACEATLNGVALFGTSAGSAVEVDRGGPLDVTIDATRDPGVVSIRFEAGPWSHTVERQDEGVVPGARWSARLSADDFAKHGAGLVQVVIDSPGNCQGSGWMKVTGASLFATTAGLVGVFLALTGLVDTGIALWFASRRRNGVVLAVPAGLGLGVAFVLLAWQSGLAPLVPLTLLAWGLPPLILVPAAAFFVLRRAGGLAIPDDDDDDEDDSDVTGAAN